MRRTLRVLGQSARNLVRNRLRTFFMMLGTFAGVAALIVTLALGRGTQQDVLERMNRMLGGSSILLRAGAGQTRGGPHGPPTTTLTLADLSAIDSAVSVVELTDPLMMAGAREVLWNGTSASISIAGHSERAEIVWQRSVIRGAYFTAAEVESAARVALVGQTVVRNLFDGRDPIGEQIRIGAIPFQVIGVLEAIGMDPHGIDKDNEIIIPISTMMRRVMNVDHIFNGKLALTPGSDVDGAVLEVEDVLRRRHQLGPDEPNDFEMFTAVQVQQMIRSANRVFTVLLPLVAAASILVGGLVVANLMSMAVNERRAEIGLRKAVGARAADIRTQFLLESATVTLLGGTLALLGGWGVLQFLAMHGRVADMPWGGALLGLAVSAFVGAIAGVAPARRAASLDPVQTLR